MGPFLYAGASADNAEKGEERGKARKKGGEEEVERIPLQAPRTLSRAQDNLDLWCQEALQMEAKVVARSIDGALHCVLVSELDIRKTGMCYDSCLYEFECPGAPSSSAKPIKADFSQEDTTRLLKLTCSKSGSLRRFRA